MTERRHPNVANLDEVQPLSLEQMGLDTSRHQERFSCQDRWLAAATGGVQLGCSQYEVPPGRTAWPRHWHAANEEALFILEGEGTLRIGEAVVQVRAGDYASLLAGPEHAHALVNTGTQPLRYLCMSTTIKVEVAGYPDSGKIGALARGPDGKPWVRLLSPATGGQGYYDGEPTEPAA